MTRSIRLSSQDAIIEAAFAVFSKNRSAALFDANFPARSALGANGLALGARVEVECIAKR